MTSEGGGVTGHVTVVCFDVSKLIYRYRLAKYFSKKVAHTYFRV